MKEAYQSKAREGEEDGIEPHSEVLVCWGIISEGVEGVVVLCVHGFCDKDYGVSMFVSRYQLSVN